MQRVGLVTGLILNTGPFRMNGVPCCMPRQRLVVFIFLVPQKVPRTRWFALLRRVGIEPIP